MELLIGERARRALGCFVATPTARGSTPSKQKAEFRRRQLSHAFGPCSCRPADWQLAVAVIEELFIRRSRYSLCCK